MLTESDPIVEDITRALGGNIMKTTVVSEVAKRLLAFITNGHLEPGTRLPSERQLASSLEVGRSAVREAIAVLDILGIVETRPGAGTYLLGNASELLPQTLSWGLMLSRPKTENLLELRHGLELQTVELATDRATDIEIARIVSCVDEMEANIDDLGQFVESDANFHREIAIASQNVVIRDLLQSVRSLLRVWAERALQDREQALVTLVEHRAISDALHERDVRAATAAMAKHMVTARDRIWSAYEAEQNGVLRSQNRVFSF